MRIRKSVQELYYPPICGWKDLAARELDPTRKVHDLSQAVPNYPPPDEIRKALRGAIEEPEYSQYTADEGLPELRDAVRAELRRLYACDAGAENICVTAGANNAFFSALNTLAAAGDKIVFLAPYFFNYFMAARICGMRPVEIVRRADDGFALPLQEIEDRLTPDTRAVVLVNPCNPTGRSCSQEEVAGLFKLCRSRGVTLISDEVYNYFHDEPDRPASVLNIPGFEESAVCIHSYSKTFSLTGFRVGFLAGSPGFLREFIKVHDTNVICAPRIAQHAALAGLREAGAWLKEKTAVMRGRIEAFKSAFARTSSRFSLLSAGAFFVYLRGGGKTGEEICEDLIRRENIVAIPGGVFGPGQERCVRLALGNAPAEDIPEVVEKLARYGQA